VELKKVSELIGGDPIRKKLQMETPAGMDDTIGLLVWAARNHRAEPTGTMKNLLDDGKAMILDAIQMLERIDASLDEIEAKALEQGVPFWD
jgi:hypothetical protein